MLDNIKSDEQFNYESSLTLSLTLLFISIFTSVVNAQTASKNEVNLTTTSAKNLLAQTEETTAPSVITFEPRSPALPLPAATFTSVATGTCGLP